MTKFNQIYRWLKTCPGLQRLWVISSEMKDERYILQPNSAANMYNVNYEPYRDGGGRYFFNPVEPYYFDVDVICYRTFYADENTVNLDIQSELQQVCDWIIGEQNAGTAPFEDCFQIECLSPQPFIRGLYASESDPGGIMVDYAITIRFYTKNPAKRQVHLK